MLSRIVNNNKIQQQILVNARHFQHTPIAHKNGVRRFYAPHRDLEFFEFDPWSDAWFKDETRPQKWKPSMDMKETDTSFIVTTELAGVSPNDISVDIDKDFLKISGEKKVETVDKKENYTITERSYGKFFRKLPLTSQIDRENIIADFDNGVLKVTLPKQQHQNSAIKINVNSNTRAIEKE